MQLFNRISKLEGKVSPAKRFYLIVSRYGESPAQAKQRYCADNQIAIDELDASESRVKMVRFVKPGDFTRH